MAGAGYKLFNTGDVLTAAQVNTYLNEQTVMVFASSAARTSALSGVLAEGMVSYLQDTNAVEVYNGTAWVGVSGAGDLTEIVAGTGITVTSGTGPIPTVALTTPVAATNGGTAQTTYTTGDLLYASGTNTLAKRAIGSTGNVLTVSGGIPTWAAPAAGSFAGCSLSKSAAQSISNATWTAISWNLENYDTDAFHDNSTNNTRITIPAGKGGKYLIASNLYNPSNSTGSRLIKIQKNGADIAYGDWQRANSGHSTSTIFSQVLALAVADYIEVNLYQDSGGALDVNPSIESTFTATYLGA